MFRRQLLRRAAGTATGLSIASAASGGVQTAENRYQSQPDHVTLSGNEARLRAYRPLLDLRAVPTSLTTELTMYGWIAESDRHTTDCYVYFGWYPFQDGLADADSHVPDREPIYLFVNSGTGAVERVTYDAYHYLAYTDLGPRLYRDTHPYLRVIAPWHPYRRPSPSAATDSAQFVETRSLHERYQAWLESGWRVHRPAVVDPWSIATRRHWWAGSLSGTVEHQLAQTSLGINNTLGVSLPGFPGAESDLVTGVQS